MSQLNRHKSFTGLRCIGSLAIALTNLWAWQSVNAQLIPDRTLGAENSSVTPQGVRDLIEGGAKRGGNLFHSFREFNVGNTQQVYFANPSGITNILTRVTGKNVSNILGTLGVDGAANLFLINPNGIIFGAGARLDVSGSFVASTADGIKLGENGLFSARQPENSTLLSIQPGVLFSDALRSHQAEIHNQGSLAVGTGQTLTLQGNIVTSTGNLSAPGGTVEVLGQRVSLLNNASIDVSAPTAGGTAIVGKGEQINIGSSVRINADAKKNGLGGTVIVKSDSTTRFEGYISARGGEDSGNGGFVEVSGGDVKFTGSVNTTAANGTVGTLLLDPKDILIQQGGTLSGRAVGQALATNDVILQANNDITIDDNITGTRRNSLTLQAGRSLTIADNRGILLNGGSFSAKINDENALASERDAGVAQFVMNPGSRILTNGGNVAIASGSFGQTSEINTTNGTILTSNAVGISSGNITLLALGDITTGNLDTRGNGKGGDITIASTGGAIATTKPVLADSLVQAGKITLNAAGNLNINSNITANSPQQAGDISLTAAGNISITADYLDISSNGNINSSGATPGKVTIASGGILSIKRVIIANAILSPGTPSAIANGITLTAKAIALEDSSVVANTFSDSRGGDILVNATDEVVLDSSAISTIADSLSDNVQPSGSAGNLTLNTRRLTIIRNPESTFPFSVGVGALAQPRSTGNGGDLTINASESVEIVGDRPGAFTYGPGQVIQTLVEFGTGISTSALGSGNSGKLTINTGRLVVRDGAGITTFPTIGNGGDLTVNATDIFLQGQGGIGTATLGSGNAGNLILNADQVTLTDGAGIATITTRTATGNAGKLTLSVGQLSIQNGSAVSTTTVGKGDGETLTIKNSESIEVSGTSPDGSFPSSIRADSMGTGKAGTLNIETEKLIARQGGEVTVSAQDTNNAGDINIGARSILLDNGSISATSFSGEGGNINLKVADNLILRHYSQISTRAGSQPSDRGNGGNMDIDAQFIVAIPKENSDIIANAFAGNGGTINITAQGIFGLQVNNTKEPLPTSEISASSQLGIDGSININTPDVDPSKGLTELPSNLSDSSNQIVAGCPAEKGNRFVVTGRGGIPDSPSQYLRGRAVWRDTRNLSAANRPTQLITDNQPSTTSTKPSDGEVQAIASKASDNNVNDPALIEAQGWIVNENGMVILTAEPYRERQANSWIFSQSCEDISQ